MRVRWEGMPGGPGVSTLYTTTGTVDMPVLANFFADIKSYVPDDVTFVVEGGGDTIDAENGDLLGAWGTGATGPCAATGTSSYSAPVGLMIKWETGMIAAGHRVRGKTYIVPALSTCFNLGGQVDATVLAAVTAKAQSYATTASGAVVWNRPKPGHAGGALGIVSGTCSPKAAIMRSRRD